MSELPENRRLSDDLRAVLAAAGGQSLPVREILTHTQGRGLQAIAIILCLPFLSPVSVPFLSIPFGVAVAVCGLRIAFRHGPWLPEMILARKIPYPALEKMLHVGIGIHTRLEKRLKPRWPVFVDGHAARMAAGFTIAFAAVLLSLPIPPPFPLTNTIPGIAIIFLCLGTLERDGLLIAAGYVLTAIGTIYVGLIAFLGKTGVEALWAWLFG